jgi:Protein of unknown function (DUF3486)
MSDRRRGKVARLPEEVRQVVNQMMRDGKPYAEIVSHLTSVGQPGIVERNLSRWFRGGFQDWLREQQQVEEMQAERAFAERIGKEGSGNPMHEAGLQVATAQLFGMLARLDWRALQANVEADPKAYAEVMRLFLRLSSRLVELEKFKLAASKVHAEDLPKGEGGIRPETLERIKKELKLF